MTRNGWLRAGITETLKIRSLKLPLLDPFLNMCRNIDFLVNENPSQVEFALSKLVNPVELLPEHTDLESDLD